MPTIRYLNEKETIDFLRSIIASKKNVPFIGSGFTCGESAKKTTVPNGNQWMEIMRMQILSAPSGVKKPNENELNKCSFQELSDIYFKEDIVPLVQIKKTLDDHFTNVTISSPTKKAFLNLGWSYLYTLNIDDAIESELNAVKVLPYEPFLPYTGRIFVYKMHGDVFTALTATDCNGLKLIFGNADYIKSLKKNEYLISTLTNDFVESNLIFIGCSLIDEIDILYAISGEKDNEHTSKRIYVTSNEPEYMTNLKLKRYGITDVLVCDYDFFYLRYAELANEINSEPVGDNPFLFENLDEVPVDKSFDNKKFFQYLIQSNWDGRNPKNLSITRTIESQIFKAIDSQPVIAIKGARFSGRTSLLYAILNKISGKRRFFIDSNRSIADRDFDELIAYKDSLIVFDSESLTWNQMRDICEKRDSIHERNTTIIMGISRGAATTIQNLSLEQNIFDLSDKFDSIEIEKINKIFDSVGLEKWRGKERLLDNIYHTANTAVINKLINGDSSLKNKIQQRVDYICHSGIAFHEFAIIYCLAARQRMFSLQYREVLKVDGLSSTGETRIANIVKLWDPFIEMINVDSISHKSTHSRTELTSNSEAWIYFALHLITLKIGYEKTADNIVQTITALKSVDNDYHKLIMFDTLNAVFNANSMTKQHISARNLIGTVYEKLAPLFSESPNYWLQRAKSVYHNHLNNEVNDVLIAIEYTNKAIKEGSNNIAVNAKLTRASLYGLLCLLDKYTSESYMFKAVDMYSEVFDDYHKNSLYLDGIVERNKTDGYLRKLINHVDNMEKSLSFLTVKTKVDQLRGILSTSKKR